MLIRSKSAEVLGASMAPVKCGKRTNNMEQYGPHFLPTMGLLSTNCSQRSKEQYNETRSNITCNVCFSTIICDGSDTAGGAV